MSPAEKERFIRNRAKEHVVPANEKILWSLHAVGKLRSEGLRKKNIEDSLKDCEIIEDYPDTGRPMPACLALGSIDSVPVHIVVAIDGNLDRIFIVTVYKPSEERWKDGWKKRKSQD